MRSKTDFVCPQCGEYLDLYVNTTVKVNNIDVPLEYHLECPLGHDILGD